MKNYIANGESISTRCVSWPTTSANNVTENGSWDTSKALVRRTLERCIHIGRQHRAQGRKEDEYEAYRLLGTAVSSYYHMRINLLTIISFTRLRILLLTPTSVS